MTDLLGTIVENARRRCAERMRRVPESELLRQVDDAEPPRSLYAALDGRFSVIAEHKRRSPSGGGMNADNLSRALDVYAAADWVSAISVLTDEDYFSGSLGDLQAARKKAGGRPVLRKDFIVEEYQVLEARAFGADAFLLMTALFSDAPDRLRALFELGRSLGMDALFEIGEQDRPAAELAQCIPNDARIWGVNSRKFENETANGAANAANGRDASTSLLRHASLLRLVPEGKIAVAESGILDAADLRTTRDAGYHAALIGTAFLKGPRPIEAVARELAGVFV
ncbi:MAG TPA: indole-3-glycerol phosphate synthase TrpC [Polyangiaceae bacterium]|jgi:indole-3-glycerol phosphate synthase